MRKRIIIIFVLWMLCFMLSACSAKLTTIRPTLVTNIQVENIVTGDKAELIREVNEDTDWLMDDLIFQMAQFYKVEGACVETDGHLYDAKYYLNDKVELSVMINSDGSVCKNGLRHVQSEEHSTIDRSVNIDQWSECFVLAEILE